MYKYLKNFRFVPIFICSIFSFKLLSVMHTSVDWVWEIPAGISQIGASASQKILLFITMTHFYKIPIYGKFVYIIFIAFIIYAFFFSNTRYWIFLSYYNPNMYEFKQILPFIGTPLSFGICAFLTYLNNKYT